MPTIVVVILNWNGGKDTVECLDSLMHQTPRQLRLVVVDNGSQDDSIARIEAWAAGHQGDVRVASYSRIEAEAGGREADEKELRQHSAGVQLVVVSAGENLGFAAGSNVGVRYALKVGAEYVLLLNNDTVVAPEAIAKLVGFLTDHPDYVAATGQIRYFARPVIWNCGGNLTWFGSRRYLFSEQPASAAPQSGWRRITFITGCATLVRTSVFQELGLLTERFFFGEEDYEFSLRMQRARHSMACCFDSVIQHRVGSSIDRVAPTGAMGRYYIYYLNRFIDMRDYYPRPLWWLWRMATLAFILPRLRISQHMGWRNLEMLGRRLLSDSTRLQGVSRERFEAATRSGLDSL
jgi:GT2 family glycosyltransferase